MHRRIELGLRGLSALVIVFATVGCQTQRSGTLLDWFMSAVSDPTAQGEGPVTGSMKVALGGQTTTVEASGHFKYLGIDCAYSTRTSRGVLATTAEKVNLGEWTYKRDDQGPWVRSARDSSCPMADIEAAGGLIDKGLGNHFGRALYRLDVKDPEVMANDLDITYDEPADVTFSFWAEEDGTPAGMSFGASGVEATDGATAEVSLAVDWAFESHADVTIDVPQGAAEPSTNAYAQAADLQARLAGLTTAQGTVSGTYKVGDTTRKLSGSVRIGEGNTEIHILAAQSPKTVWSEIVVGGNRYVSRDDTVWVDRGSKQTSTLLDVLAAASTDRDAGARGVGGRVMRSIVSPANTLDVASAFGIDMVDVSGPGTQFRIWVDSSGDLAGFGGTLQWGKVIDGSPIAFELKIDVLFEDMGDLPIAAPKDPWKWVVDDVAGVAFGLPARFVTRQTEQIAPETMATLYVDSKKTSLVEYASLGAMPQGETAKSLMNQVASDLGFTLESRYEARVDGQSGESALGHGGQVFMIVTLAVNGSSAYLFAVGGLDAQRKDLELLTDEVLATVQLLR